MIEAQLAFQRVSTQSECRCHGNYKRLSDLAQECLSRKNEVPKIICRLDGMLPKYRREQKFLLVIPEASVKCER